MFVLQGVVAPHSVCDVPLQIRAQCLEEQETPCFIAIFGSPDPPLVSLHFVRALCLELSNFAHLGETQITHHRGLSNLYII